MTLLCNFYSLTPTHKMMKEALLLFKTQSLRLVMLSLSLLLWHTAAYAQSLTANLHAPTRQSSPMAQDEKEVVSLDEVLQKLQQQHSIKITYQSDMLDNKYLSLSEANVLLAASRKRMEASIRQLMQSYRLNFKKYNESLFTIFRQEMLPQKVEKKPLNNTESKLFSTLENLAGKEYTAVRPPLDKSISGQVTDLSTGETLPGVNIVAKGTTIGTVTDIEGNYQLSVPDETEILVFSSVGYTPEEVSIGNQTVIDVVMSPDIQSLSEVVVIGYGTQRRENISGAISTVGTEAIEGRPVADIQSALQGQVAGLQITKNSGTPGGGANVRIRGTGSITGGSDPLYVVDGNIISTGIGNSGNPFATLNPADIESVNVLKDASAAAIYGARAANGVIIITTKRGKAGKAQINFNAYAGLQQTTNKLDLLNAQQYQQVYNTVRDNSQIPRIPNLDNTNLTTNTDWQDEVFRTGTIQNYELNASGGGENTRYYTSLSHYDEEGTIIGTGFERTSLRLNTDTELGRFRFGNSLTVSQSKFDKEFEVQGVLGTLFFAIANSPAIGVLNPDNLGGFNGPTSDDGDVGVVNPVAAQTLTENRNTVNRILGNAYAEYDLLEEILTFRVNFGTDISLYKNRFYAPLFVTTPGEAVRGLPNGAQVSETRGDNVSLLLENTLSFKKKFGSHNVNLLAGYTVQDVERSDLGITVAGQNIGNSFPVISASNNIVGLPLGTIIEQRTLSYIGRAIYDYDNKYLATLNFRRDGSSLFTAENFFDNFFSGSVGWIVSNEAFMESSPFSNLKIRASYGFLGNDQIDPNATNAVLNSNARYILGNPQAVANAVAPGGQIANPDLVWEKQEQLDIGLDMSFMDSKLSFSADYFIKNSKDLLLDYNLPDATGFANIFINAAEVQNRGLELVLNYNDNFGALRFGAGFNVSLLDNKVVSLINGLDAIERNSSNEFTFRNRIEPGHSLFSFYGYKTDGIYQSDAELASGPTPITGTAPGDLRYVDVSGPDGTPDGVITEADRTFIGDANQDVQLGLNLNFGYKAFDLSLQAQGVFGNDIWSDTKFYTQSYFRTNNLSTDVLNAWTPENRSNTQPRAIASTVGNNDFASDFFVEDGSYVRLKNLQIGYNLPQQSLEKLGLRKARIYFAGQNLITITNYLGFDPEVGVSTSPNATNALGFDNLRYPQAKTYTIGVQFGF